MKHEINMLDLLIVFLSLDRTDIINSEGKLESSSAYNGTIQYAYESYMSSESEQSRYDGIINNFYTKLGITKDNLVNMEEYRIETDGSFMDKGSNLLDADLGFGDDAKFINVANVGTDIYLKIHPTNLASKIYENQNKSSDNHNESSEHNNDSNHSSTEDSSHKDTNAEVSNENNKDFKLSMKFNGKEILSSIGIFLLLKTIFKH